MHMRTLAALTTAATLATVAGATSAGPVLIPLGFEGNGGAGLLPENEVGTGAETSGSGAIGGASGSGLLYDASLNTLSFQFFFVGLTGGLADVARGIHFHIADPGVDPFNENGPIAFNLNSGTDPNVTIDTFLIPIGGTMGEVLGTAQLTDEQELDLLAGRFYLNIHSAAFGGGELRGNLVPTPGTMSVLGLIGLAGFRRRR